MRAKFGFEFMNLEDEMVAVPVGNNASQFHGVLKINETATAILKLLEKDTTVEEITEEIMKQYSGDKNDITGFVREFTDRLIAEGIVE